MGAAIPALVQARATLRALESVLRRSGPRLDEALGVTASAAGGSTTGAAPPHIVGTWVG